MINKIVFFLLISGLIYFSLALVLIVIGRAKGESDLSFNQSFDEMLIDYSHLPELLTYRARDGVELDYRLYPADSDKTLILIHGSGWHSRYFLPLAEAIAASGAARVITPDLRGHGRSPVRRGDIDYIDQLTDDLVDLIDYIGSVYPKTRIIIGGHSSGGGLAVRFGGTKEGRRAKGYLLMAPFLKYNAPTTRPNSGDWARPYTARIAGLSMLNNVGITWLNYLPVIDFNMPEEARDGTETLVYSHRLNTGYAPADYRKDLGKMSQPLLVLAGEDDKSFYADRYGPTITKYTPASVKILPGVSHLGLVVVPEVQPLIIDWLVGLDG